MRNKPNRTPEEIKALMEKYKDPDAMKKAVEGMADELAGKIIDREIEHA